MKSLLLQTKATVDKILKLLILQFESQKELPDRTARQSGSIELENPELILLDAQDVQRLLKIGRSTYYRWVGSGLLNPIRIGGRHYYSPSLIEDLKATMDSC